MPTSNQTVTHYKWDDMPKENVSPLLDRRLITGNRMMIAHVYLKKGCIVPKHHHENEQITYIIDGELKFWIGEDESQIVHVKAGEVLTIPSNVPHKAEAIVDTSTSTSSIRRGRTGWTRPIRICGNSAWISVSETRSRSSRPRAKDSGARSPRRSRRKVRR